MDVNVMLGVGDDVGYGRCGGSGWGVRMNVNEELKFLRKFTKKRIFFFFFFFFGGGGSGVWLGGQGGCERRIEVFGKIHKTNSGGGREAGGVGGGLVGRGGSGWM